MKAAILDKYDKQGRSLTITDVPIPEIENGEVLVKVRTAGVNPLDNMIVRGEVKLIVPYTMPLVMGSTIISSLCMKTGKVFKKCHACLPRSASPHPLMTCLVWTMLIRL